MSVATATAYRGSIRLLLLDVDGVLTSGAFTVDAAGTQSMAFNTRDGPAVALLRHYGIATGIVSGRNSPALRYRTEQLGIEICKLGVEDKLEALDELVGRLDLTFDAVAYVGDDIIDLPLCGVVGRFFAPCDAHDLVLLNADHVLKRPGGGGAGREAAELVLQLGGLSLEAMYAPLLNASSKDRSRQ